MVAPYLSGPVPMPSGNPAIRVSGVRTLSDNWYVLRAYDIEAQRADGTWQPQSREVYDRGNGAAILLYSRPRQTVVLVRQFRLATYVNGNADGMLLEVPAGLLDDLSAAEAIRKETAEETGFSVRAAEQVFDVFMSPGSVSERLHLFIAEYEPEDRVAQGGGVADEGEDIEVVELPFDAALAMAADGRIRDGKTILLLYHLKIKGIMG